MRVNIRQNLIRITCICIFLFCFTSIFSLLSVRLDNPIIKLWKEMIVIFYYLLSIFYMICCRKVSYKKLFIIIFSPAFVFVFYVATTLNDPLILVFYQMKSDLVPLLFVLGVVAIINSYAEAEELYYKLIKIILIVGCINVVLIVIQKIFTEWFMIFLQIDDFNNSSRDSGLRLDNVNDSLRAMGSFTSFIASGTLMVLCFIIVNEVKKIKLKTRLILSAMFLSAAIATTYKTAIIGISIYLILKVVLGVFTKGGGTIRNTIVIAYTVIVFTVSAFCFNDYFLYNQLKNTTFHDSAYGSIYIRVKQHNDIFESVEKGNILTGAGIGTNGTEGPKGFKSNSKALDSTYINILSNYGLLGVIIYLAILFFLILYLSIKKNPLGANVSIMLLLYHLDIEFFTNNILMDFPLNLFFYLLIAFSIFYSQSDEKSITEKMQMEVEEC